MMKPIPGDLPQLTRQMSKDINSLQRRGRGAHDSGPVELRDLVHTAPTTPEERIALAGTRWFDTALGLWHQFYAAFDDPGVSPGTSANEPGWYPADARMPYFLVDKDADQNAASGALTTVQWPASGATIDPFEMYDPALSVGGITIPFQGLWRVHAHVRISGVAAGSMDVYRDGTVYPRGRAGNDGAAGAATTLDIDVPVYCEVGAQLQIRATWQAAVVITGSPETYFEVTYMGPPAK